MTSLSLYTYIYIYIHIYIYIYIYTYSGAVGSHPSSSLRLRQWLCSPHRRARRAPAAASAYDYTCLNIIFLVSPLVRASNVRGLFGIII